MGMTFASFDHCASLSSCGLVTAPPSRAPLNRSELASIGARSRWALIDAFSLQELLGSYYGGMPAMLGDCHWGTSCSRVTHRSRRNHFARLLTAPTVWSRQLAHLQLAKNR